MKRLSVDDLQVATFATVPETQEPSLPGLETLSECMTDPTAMTMCYICPVEPFTQEQQFA